MRDPPDSDANLLLHVKQSPMKKREEEEGLLQEKRMNENQSQRCVIEIAIISKCRTQ